MFAQLEPKRIWLERLDIRLARAGTGAGEEDYTIDVSPKVWANKDRKSFKVRLPVTMKPAKDATCRYSKIEAVTTGVFDIAPDTPEDLVRQLVPLNCYVILYGFARGVVAQVTGLNPGGPFLLPALNFLKLLHADNAEGSPAEDQS